MVAVQQQQRGVLPRRIGCDRQVTRTLPPPLLQPVAMDLSENIKDIVGTTQIIVGNVARV